VYVEIQGSHSSAPSEWGETYWPLLFQSHGWDESPVSFWQGDS
jgi:hypothetical protein